MIQKQHLFVFLFYCIWFNNVISSVLEMTFTNTQALTIQLHSLWNLCCLCFVAESVPFLLANAVYQQSKWSIFKYCSFYLIFIIIIVVLSHFCVYCVGLIHVDLSLDLLFTNTATQLLNALNFWSGHEAIAEVHH